MGRPDLHANVDEARSRAALLYKSVRQLLALGGEVLVFPGHTSEPSAFDGIPIAERLDVIAERLGTLVESENIFVERILTRIPSTPPNYERIVEFNERGELPDGDLTELEAGANRCAVST